MGGHVGRRWRSNHGIWFARGNATGCPTTGNKSPNLWGACVTLSLGGRVGDQEDMSHEPAFERVYVSLYCPVMLTNTCAGIKTAKKTLPRTRSTSCLRPGRHFVERGCC